MDIKVKNGFLQDPKSKEIEGKLYHLEDILNHGKSGNQYQIKEIQSKGLVAVVHNSPIDKLVGTKAYISNDALKEYHL